MKAKVLTIIFGIAILVSFSFITVNKGVKFDSEKNKIENNTLEPMSGFAMEDTDGF